MVAKTYSSFDYIDQPATPFWTFEFKYLSRGTLASYSVELCWTVALTRSPPRTVLLELGGHVECAP